MQCQEDFTGRLCGVKKIMQATNEEDDAGNLGGADTKHNGITKWIHSHLWICSHLNLRPLVLDDNETNNVGLANLKNMGIAQWTGSHLNQIHLIQAPLLPNDYETGNLGGADSKNRGIPSGLTPV
ncbi:hypothetical protein ACLOJK_023745 [Asimina triloba]